MNAPSPPKSAAEHPSLFGVLAARARHATDTRLVVDAAIGTTLAATIALIRPSLWVLAMPAVVLAAYGAWGIADREFAGRAAGAPRTALGVLRGAFVVLGLIAALAFTLGALGVALGGWIL